MKIAVTSDLHFMAWADTLEPVDHVPCLYHALHDIAEQRPDLVVINGDLTNGKARDYDLAMRAIHHYLDMPVLFTMGNHEYYGYYEDKGYSWSMAQQRFLSYTGQDTIYKSLDLDDVRLVLLSTEGYHPDWHDAAWLSPTQLRWFESTTKDWRGRLIVFLHQPINGTVVNSEMTCFQSEEIQSILAHRPNTFVISGHTHQRMDQPGQFQYRDGVYYVGGGCTLDAHPQSRFIELTESTTTFRIRDHKSMRWLDDGYCFTVPVSTVV